MTPSSIKDDFSLPLGGTVYRFHWGVDELIDMQEQLTTATEVDLPGVGKRRIFDVPDVEDLNMGVWQGRLKYTRALLVAGLRYYQPKLSREDVNAAMQASSAEEMSAVLAAFGYAVTPDPKDVGVLKASPKQARNPRKAQATRTNGGTSTSAPADAV